MRAHESRGVREYHSRLPASACSVGRRGRLAGTLVVSLLATLALSAPAIAAFPGANGKIAFTSVRDEPINGEDIYTVNADGTGESRLTASPDGDTHADWSPDGKKIAFTSVRAGNYEIYTMNADGTGLARLTNLAFDQVTPDWAPDGSKIAFRNDSSGDSEIYTMSATGTNQTNVTNNAAEDHDPVWSPDGSKIAFTSGRDGNYEIYTMNADGTGVTRLTDDAAEDFGPDWSPDGTELAFASRRDGNYEIYTMNRDGTGQTRITSNEVDDYQPAWAPDGTKIAFTHRDPVSYEIYTMSPDGTSQNNVTNNTGNDFAADWQWVNAPPVADDQSVYAASGYTTSITLSATDPEGRPLRFSTLTRPRQGQLSGTPPNLLYKPRKGYTGPDSFTFRVSDGVLTDTATVSITVVANDIPPQIAGGNTCVVTSDGYLPTLSRQFSYQDPDGPLSPPRIEILSKPQYGTLAVGGDPPTWTYTPTVNASSDQFTWRAFDGIFWTTADTEILTAVPSNRPCFFDRRRFHG